MVESQSNSIPSREPHVQTDCEAFKPINDFVSENRSTPHYKVIPVSKIDEKLFSDSANLIARVPEKYSVRLCSESKIGKMPHRAYEPGEHCRKSAKVDILSNADTTLPRSESFIRMLHYDIYLKNGPVMNRVRDSINDSLSQIKNQEREKAIANDKIMFHKSFHDDGISQSISPLTMDCLKDRLGSDMLKQKLGNNRDSVSKLHNALGGVHQCKNKISADSSANQEQSCRGDERYEHHFPPSSLDHLSAQPEEMDDTSKSNDGIAFHDDDRSENSNSSPFSRIRSWEGIDYQNDQCQTEMKEQDKQISESDHENFFVLDQESNDYRFMKFPSFAMIKEECDRSQTTIISKSASRCCKGTHSSLDHIPITPFNTTPHKSVQDEFHAEEYTLLSLPSRRHNRTDEHEIDTDQQSSSNLNCDGLVVESENAVAINTSIDGRFETTTYKQKLYDLQQELRDIRRVLETQASQHSRKSLPKAIAFE
mmetsp:Transcript_10548/g.22573  ORF Transcript_10548/g.22573 Transcript_10548/m.22573 type:complete len:481 (+) Transcript_10548:776-2218(+)